MARTIATFSLLKKPCVQLREFLVILAFTSKPVIANAEIIFISFVAEIPWVVPILRLLPIGKDQAAIIAVSYVLHLFLKRALR